MACRVVAIHQLEQNIHTKYLVSPKPTRLIKIVHSSRTEENPSQPSAKRSMSVTHQMAAAKWNKIFVPGTKIFCELLMPT